MTLKAMEIDDDDDVSIIEEVEKTFGLTISDAEAIACETVGDLFALVCSKVPVVDLGGQLPCLTASAFRAIRRAIQLRKPTLHVRPDARLDSIIDGRDHRDWRDYLTSHTGLRFPNPSLQNFNVLLAGFVSVSGGVFLLIGISIPNLFLAGVIGLIATIVIGRRYSQWAWSDFDTIGELARQATALSIAQAIRANGSIRKVEAWNALIAVVRPFSQRTGEIGPQTRFFSERR